MENKQKLENLIKRNEELRPIVFKSFKAEKELDNYSKKIQKEVDEYYYNQDQIEQLKWELMTPEEQKAEKELIKKMKLKREGKL